MGKKKENKMKKTSILLMAVIMVMMCSFSFAENSIFGESHEYIVKKGDKPLDVIVTLSITSKTTPDQIIEWNPDLALHNIQIGQKVKYYVKTKDKVKTEHILLICLVSATLVFLFAMIAHSMLKKSISNKLSQRVSFPIAIDGKKYIYTPQSTGIYFVSLFNGGKYKSSQDAFKSSRKLLQIQPGLAEKEISAGRLKLMI